MKTCTKCNQTLPLESFHKHAQCKHGYNTVCKACRVPLSKSNYKQRSPEQKMWERAKGRAKRKNREFSITIEDIVIPEVCPVLNIPMLHPSLDRFDSSKGYSKDNIRVISYRANVLKNNASVEELEAVLRYLKGEV